MVDGDAADLLALTAALVDVRSESHDEAELADLVEARLAERAPGLAVERVGTNVIARTELGRDDASCSAATSTPCPPERERGAAASRATCSTVSARPT